MSGDRMKNVFCFITMLVIFAMAFMIDRSEVTPVIRYATYGVSALGLICLSALISKPLSTRPGSIVLETLGAQADPLIPGKSNWRNNKRRWKYWLGSLSSAI